MTMAHFGASSASKFGVLFALYFSQGLPFGFFTQALPMLLRKHAVSLSQIGLSTLLALPWALKFLWAPSVERHYFPRLGRRKSWIVPLQLLSVATLTVLALLPDSQALSPLLIATFVLNLLSATQDIATDGFAVDVLEARELGIGNGIQVAAYRVGMIVGGGLLLMLYDRIGPRLTFAAMALLTVIATWPILMTRESPHAPRVAESSHFLRRSGALRILLVLVAYKSGDAFATAMLRPYLADLGLTLADVGVLLGTVGFLAGLCGALVGGALVNVFGKRRALLGFGLLQALSVAAYALLAAGTPSLSTLYLVCGVEHFAGGMATAALFTCMMSWCSREASATDFTVQASAVVIATGVAGAVSGFSAEALGYFWHFCLGTALCFAALLLTMRWFPRAEWMASEGAFA